MEIAFNARYLLRCEEIAADTVTLSFSTPLKPLLIRPVSEKKTTRIWFYRYAWGRKPDEYRRITTESIRLDQALKLAGITGTGGESKYLIQEGLVSVNQEELGGQKVAR